MYFVLYLFSYFIVYLFTYNNSHLYALTQKNGLKLLELEIHLNDTNIHGKFIWKPFNIGFNWCLLASKSIIQLSLQTSMTSELVSRTQA